VCLAAGAMSKRGNKTTTTTRRRDELGQRRIFLRDHSFVYCKLIQKIPISKTQIPDLAFSNQRLDQRGTRRTHSAYHISSTQLSEKERIRNRPSLELAWICSICHRAWTWTRTGQRQGEVHGRQNFEIPSGAAPVPVRIRPVSRVCGSAPLFPFD